MRKLSKKTIIKMTLLLIPVILVAFLFVQSYTMAYYTDNKEEVFRIDVELLTYELSSSSPSFDSSDNTITVSGQTSVDVSLYIGSTNSIESKYNLNYIINSGTNISCVYRTGDSPTGTLPAYWEPSHALNGVSVNLRCINKSAAVASVKLYVDGGYTDETLVLPTGRETIQEEAKVVNVEAGSDHTLAITNDGKMYAWGDNSNYQLGDGTFNNKSIPTLISRISDVKEMSAGRFHTVAVTNDGKVYTWGYYTGSDGSNQSVPRLVNGISNVKQTSSGYYHIVAVTNDGQVYTWAASNSYGELGDGTTTYRYVPTSISGLINVKQVSAGQFHTVAVTNDGKLYAWGNNEDGQLGDGTTTNRLIPKLISGISDVKQVSAGDSYTVAVTNDGKVYTWGSDSGALGAGTTTQRMVPTLVGGISDVKEVLAEFHQTFAITNDGKVYAWGRNMEGQLGDGTTVGKNVPTLISGIIDVKEVASGYYHAIAVTNDGNVYAWGRNTYGTLGDGTSGTGTDKLVPTLISLPQ